MKRRTFIYGIAGLAAVSFPTVYYFVGREIDYDSLITEPRFLSGLLDVETINLIGDQYILQVPREAKERKLVKLLTRAVPTESTDIASDLHEKIKTDFKENKTVILDGWVLSVTEARQCALLSTLKNQ